MSIAGVGFSTDLSFMEKQWKLTPKPLIKTQKLSVFDHYSIVLSEPQDLRAGGQHSIIPYGWHKKRCN
ncbi:MAG: hypothetical protein E3J46_09580 [Desulfobacteraceae bacterium]|nr:MAG: hypothetical protein E3J46_09580 [Desulfobacteraceae bacterium]